MSVKRLYEDPEQTMPCAVAFPVTVTMEVYFTDEGVLDIIEGSFIDTSKHTEKFDLIRARNLLADGYPDSIVKPLAIKLSKETIKECAEVLGVDISDKTVFHDVEVKY